MRVLADCPACSGAGIDRGAGAQCRECAGLGIVFSHVSEDVFFEHLPPGMTREQAKAMLARMRGPVVIPDGSS